jgi:gliding motility-associated-like protein
LSVEPNPILEINCPDTLVCLTENTMISVNGAGTYQWAGPMNFSSNNTSILLNSFTSEQAGWYVVSAISMSGCVAKDSIQIFMDNTSDCFLIPELVTPNNDGKNDVWHIQGLDPTLQSSIEIFNRWGNRIFQESDFENDWDCRSNCGLMIDEKNGLVPTGTYFFILKIEDNYESVFNGCLEIHY